MANEPKPKWNTPLDPENSEEDRKHIELLETIFSGLNFAALDILETLKKMEVKNGDSSLLTAATRFSANLWGTTMMIGGVSLEDATDAYIELATAFLKVAYRNREKALSDLAKARTNH